MRPFVRPGPLLVLVGVVLVPALMAVGKGTGAAFFITAVGVATAGALDAFWAGKRVAGAELNASSAGDAIAGHPVELSVRLTSRSPLLVELGSHVDAVWQRAHPGDSGQAVLTPPRRGRYDSMRVALLAKGPLGLVARGLEGEVRLATPLFVAPWPIPGQVPWDPTSLEAGDIASFGTEHVRSVRPFASGDRIREIHWPSVARHGELLVREREDLNGGEVVVVVDLGPSEDDVAERIAGWAWSAAGELLSSGVAVRLVTLQPEGWTSQRLRNSRDAGRALATSLPGAPPDLTEFESAVVLTPDGAFVHPVAPE